MTAPKRVLILSSNTGFGHRSAAQAIEAALHEMHPAECQVTIANPLDDPRTPAVLRTGQATYDDIVREMPQVQRVGYEAVDKLSSFGALEQAATVMLFHVVYDLLKRHQPDVVVNTYPLYLAPLEAAFVIQKRARPVVTVVTDFGTVSRVWFHSISDLCVVPTERVRQMALEARLPPETVDVIGIPVHPRLAQEARSQTELRAALGWQPNVITILAVGSRRVLRLEAALEIINHMGFAVQVAVVAGGDDALYARLQKTEWHLPAHVYNFVDDMPTLMKAADLIVSKAGGLILTEALACGLPIVMIEFIPGQETGNVDYIVENGAGVYAEPPLPLLRALSHWLLNGGQGLAEAAQKARPLGRPRAAYEIAERIWQFAQQGPTPLSRLERLRLLLPRTAALLDHFNVIWRE